MLKFIEEGHIYANTDETDSFQWVSVTTLVKQFVEPFDAEGIALKCSKGKNPKYKGKEVFEILDMWDKERNRASSMGTWYHNQREKDMLQFGSITKEGIVLPIVKPEFENGVKYAPVQKLENGIYPEHFTYLRSAGICGQADKIEVINNRLDVYDFKTNKEIKREGYEFWDGSKKMMLGPLRHLDDCEFNKFALQLSVYMYIILKHNYNLIPGKLNVHHIEFEVDHLDENGYPIYAKNPAGEFIPKKLNVIELPYLKKEVVLMFKWLQNNKNLVLNNEH